MLVMVGIRDSMPVPFLVAAPLLMPALFFGAAVAVRVDRPGEEEIVVSTLIFWRRRIPLKRLGVARLRTHAQGDMGPMWAPALWIPVKGGLPLYLDLLAKIPDRSRFRKTFQVSLPRS